MPHETPGHNSKIQHLIKSKYAPKPALPYMAALGFFIPKNNGDL